MTHHFALDFHDGKRMFVTLYEDWETTCDFMLDTRDMLKASNTYGPWATQDELDEDIAITTGDL